MHPLRCRCGSVRGRIIEGRPSNRVRCYCADCRAFAAYCGRSEGVLDSRGGTEIVQVSQARLRLDQGLDQLACLRLSPNGLLRWHSRCCKTPIGNTLANPGISMIGLIHACLDGASLDRDFGSSVALVNTDTALGDPKPKPRGVLSAFARMAILVLVDRACGRHRRSPLFTRDGAPIAPTAVLSTEEREALERSS